MSAPAIVTGERIPTFQTVAGLHMDAPVSSNESVANCPVGHKLKARRIKSRLETNLSEDKHKA